MKIDPFRLFVLRSPICTCQEGGWLCERCDRIIQEHDRIVKELQDRISDLGWSLNPDRMGG